jgi:hypothetical protein
LINVAQLERDYYEKKPDVADANQLVSFGTSGHRGTPFNATFTEAHILATTQAICEYRKAKASGPLYIGKDSTRRPRPRNAPRSKCSRPMASRRSSSARMVSRPRLRSRTPS